MQGLKPCVYANAATGGEKGLEPLRTVLETVMLRYIILPEAFARIRTVTTGLQGQGSTIKLQKQKAYNGKHIHTT